MYTILYFLDYGERLGGAANTLLQQASLMKRAGNKIMVFVSDLFGRHTAKEYVEIYARNDIEITYTTYRFSSQPEDIDIICIDENYEQLKEIIEEAKPDLLHSVQINPLVELIGRELQIPHIMNVYPLLPEFFCLDYIDVFPHYHICDSWFWAKEWNKYWGTDFTCIRTVVHLKSNAENEIKRTDEKTRYICAGVLSQGKNQLEVIKAFHNALKKGISGSLSFYGYDNNDYTEKCKSYIERNNLSELVLIKGFCADMEKVYQNSDVLICGSTRESYPNVVSEAMAYGLVVISTPVAGVPEILKDGINGYLTDDFTSQSISRKILEFHGDIGKERLEKIRRNSYKTYEQYHSPSLVTKQLLKYYDHVIRDNKKSSEVSVADIRNTFAEYINTYHENCSCFTDPKRVSLKLWYLYYMKESIETAVKKDTSVYIWGTGIYGTAVKELAEVFLPAIPIHGFLDSKKEGTFKGYTIYNPDEILPKENIVILIGVVNGQNEIIEKLKMWGKGFNKEYFILSARAW